MAQSLRTFASLGRHLAAHAPGRRSPGQAIEPSSRRHRGAPLAHIGAGNLRRLTSRVNTELPSYHILTRAHSTSDGVSADRRPDGDEASARADDPEVPSTSSPDLTLEEYKAASWIARLSGLAYLGADADLGAAVSREGLRLVAQGRNQYTHWYIADANAPPKEGQDIIRYVLTRGVAWSQLEDQWTVMQKLAQAWCGPLAWLSPTSTDPV